MISGRAKRIFSQKEFELLGYTTSDETDKAALWWSRLHEEDLHILQDNDRNYREGSINIIPRIPHVSSRRQHQVVLGPGRGGRSRADGKPLKLIGTHADITFLKDMEEERKKSEKRYRDLFNYSQALYAHTISAAKILSVNPAIQTRCTILRRNDRTNIADYVPKELRDRFGAGYLDVSWPAAGAGPIQPYPAKVRKKIYLLYQNTRWKNRHRPLYHRFSQDITSVYGRSRNCCKQAAHRGSLQSKETFLANMSHEYVRP